MLASALLLCLVTLPADAPARAPDLEPHRPSPGFMVGGVSLIASGAGVAVVTGLIEALYLANVVPTLQAGRTAGADAWVIMGGLLVTFVGSVVAVVVGVKMAAWYVKHVSLSSRGGEGRGEEKTENALNPVPPPP